MISVHLVFSDRDYTPGSLPCVVRLRVDVLFSRRTGMCIGVWHCFLNEGDYILSPSTKQLIVSVVFVLGKNTAIYMKNPQNLFHDHV